MTLNIVSSSHEVKRALKKSGFHFCTNCGYLESRPDDSTCQFCGRRKNGLDGIGCITFLSLVVIGFVFKEVVFDYARFYHPFSNIDAAIVLYIGNLVIGFSQILKMSIRDWLIPLTIRALALFFTPYLMFTYLYQSQVEQILQSETSLSYLVIVFFLLCYDFAIYRSENVKSVYCQKSVIQKRIAHLSAASESIARRVMEIDRAERSSYLEKVLEKLLNAKRIVDEELVQLKSDLSYLEILLDYLWFKEVTLSVSRELAKFRNTSIEEFGKITTSIQNYGSVVSQAASASNDNRVKDIKYKIDKGCYLLKTLNDKFMGMKALEDLSQIEMLVNYELPKQIAPILSEMKEDLSELLEEIDKRYYRVKLNADVNRILRE